MATDHTTAPPTATVPQPTPTPTPTPIPTAAAAAAAAGAAGSATAVAHPNIALVKYWGKRDEALVLPRVGSLSMTLDVFATTTRVTLAPGAGRDEVLLDGASAAGSQRQRVVAFLDLVRAGAGSTLKAVVDSRNTVPTGAGLASSASGFAALAVAAAAAYGLDLDVRGLSRLARRGSGSACRSLIAAFAQWHAGTGDLRQADLTSYAEPVPAGAGLDPALVVAVLNAGPKAVSSREAMRRTVATSPLYGPWADSSAEDLDQMRAALAAGDLEEVGRIAERNALGMHATMLAARPAVRYLAPDSLTVLDTVQGLRARGVCAYATMDAGPNVKVLCPRGQAPQVAAAIVGAVPGARVITAGPGPAAYLSAPASAVR
ncbi:diphosphomevalonate decarboxylase [Actinacidiphila rubida]|uniref:diphosphomevalonate decarboxylase n=1 Tax=Actinacidiphila rubida TaxID=310780 RepID=A0A1H8R732_9ACTN|nr:diphosphomevalonate decarboxylase [Actinacidiphila rubida]SEO62146.1 diphosphomevalonate decarboxylase [Actinacidiphila rubida]